MAFVKLRLFLLLIVICVGILIKRKSVVNLCQVDKCPSCYGTNLCRDIDDGKITLIYHSFTEFFYNLISVKNVFFAEYNGVKVVLKKLGHWGELERIPKVPENITRNDLILLLREQSGVKLCSVHLADVFLSKLMKFSLNQLWTLFQVNVEPIILEIFSRNDGWPVPYFYGSCGLLIVVENCGLSLNYFEMSNWEIRAFLALQLLEAAVNFTRNHRDFRLYLTDISPDNIAVDDEFNLFFIDLENGILTPHRRDEFHHIQQIHISQHFPDENDFTFDEIAICQSSESDHNIYAVCRLLLSRNAPWPMMVNGLLHSAPSNTEGKKISQLVEDCVEFGDRFQIAKELIELLKRVALPRS